MLAVSKSIKNKRGEKQSVAIARSLIHQPNILFADEPTASLDSKRSHDVMTLVRDIANSLQITTLLVTHEDEMLTYADQIVNKKDGEIIPSSYRKRPPSYLSGSA